MRPNVQLRHLQFADWRREQQQSRKERPILGALLHSKSFVVPIWLLGMCIVARSPAAPFCITVIARTVRQLRSPVPPFVGVAPEDTLRLIDIVLQSPQHQTCIENGLPRLMPAAGSLKRAIQDCSLRYVLDRMASSQCSALMFASNGPISDPRDLPSLPDRPFWLECYPDEQPTAGSAPGRLGFFIDSDGRRGTIECVAETRAGGACLLAGRVDFDLTAPLLQAGDRSHRMRHQDGPAIDGLLAHARLEIDAEWSKHARTLPGRYQDFLAWQAERAWPALPIVITFAALLNARTALVQRPSSLSRLNDARRRRGKPLLAEHVEVTLNLTPGDPACRRDADSGGDRHAPRLHFVRGHQVTRAGRSFWRSSHFRGEGMAEIAKTVRVTARAGNLSSSWPSGKSSLGLQ